MKNSIGTSVILTLFGESHGEYIGAILDGFTPGIKVDEDFINKMLARRRPSLSSDTARKENDDYQIISGVFNGYTTGSPITILIKNSDTRSNDYSKDLFRPSHADLTSEYKYHGYQDYRGGGHFSGRLTAPIVALGSICLKALNDKGIYIASHILRCGKVKDKKFDNIKENTEIISKRNIPVIDNIEDKVLNEITNAKNVLDSIGGILECGIEGLPKGLGEPWFSSLEGVIANAMLSIGGVKGIEFGLGFDFADHLGSEVNDEPYFDNGDIKTKTNNNGGINGGISNGMPVIFNLAIKPTPSIAKTQNSVSLDKNENVEINIKGRHDPAIIRRISPVVDALLAIVICDELTKRFGTDYLK